MLLAAVVFLLPCNIMADGGDEMGMWLELGATKALPRNFSISLEAGMRSQVNPGALDRLDIGLGLQYKVNKYLKFGTSYMFMGSYSPEERKEHYNSSGNWNGYNLDESFWTPRHRVNVDVTGGYKIAGWVRISLRERYQYTYGYEEYYNQEKYRYNSSGTLKPGYPISETDYKAEERRHILRSRLKVEMSRKGIKWNPFVSLEFQNDLSDAFSLYKIRTRVGTEYHFNKKHAIGLAYVLTHRYKTKDNVETCKRIHAICASYNFDF